MRMMRILPGMNNPVLTYRGRFAPSPTGFLHAGHMRTFQTARERAQAAGGTMILRVEDLDAARCRPEFREAVLEDMRKFGLSWSEGPDVGGPFAPYRQSDRRPHYLAVWRRLVDLGMIYPCRCSRKDILLAGAPHPEDEEPTYPGTCRELRMEAEEPAGWSWRFQVPDGERVAFEDGRLGRCEAVAGVDFGDFVVWRRDDVPSYQLAVVADDMAMGITEVVRGEDLLTSTFRQLLLYRALGGAAPDFFHAAMVTDGKGRRLAKRRM